MEGRLLSGDRCTVVFVRERGAWPLYPFGLEQVAVRLTDGDVRKIADVLGGQP